MSVEGSPGSWGSLSGQPPRPRTAPPWAAPRAAQPPCAPVLRVWGLGLRVLGLGFRDAGLGFRVEGREREFRV